MTFKRHKIFASGVHKNDKDPVWPPDRVREVFDSTQRYSPSRIPYTFRHPENSLPVLGYASRESVELFEDPASGRMYITAEPSDFAAQLIPGLKQAGADKVSIGIGRKGEIVHIGMTDKPAVSGLDAVFEAQRAVAPVYQEEVDFEADDLGNPVEAFEVDWKWRLDAWMSDVAALFKKMREREIEANGVEEADKFLPTYLLDFLSDPLPGDPEVEVSERFENTNEGDDMVMSEAEKLEMQRLKDENKRLMQEAKANESAALRSDIEGFCDQHKDKIVPKVRDQVVGILLDLHGKEPREFEAGDGKKEQRTSFEVLKGLLAGGKAQLVFEEVATKDGAPDGDDGDSQADPVRDALQAQFEAAKGK